MGKQQHNVHQVCPTRRCIGAQPLVLVLTWAMTLASAFTGAALAAQDATTAPLAVIEADPTPLGPAPQWLPALLRVVDAAGLLRPEDRAFTDATLVAATLGSYPHRIALLDLTARRDGKGADHLTGLQLALTLRNSADTTPLRQTLETLLRQRGPAVPYTQEPFTLAGGLPAVRYHRSDWPAWLCVEWAADGGRFHVGVGAGALQRWLALREVGEDVFAAHDRAAGLLEDSDAAADGARIFRALVDLDRLRQVAPLVLGQGRVRSLLVLFGFEDRGALALDAKLAERVVWLTSSTRRGDTTTAAALTAARWPADAAVPPPPGTFNLAAPLDWPAALVRARQVLAILRGDGPPTARERATERLLATLAEQAGAFEPWLLISDHPRSRLPIPGAASVYVPVRAGMDAAAAAERLEASIAALPRDPEQNPARRLGVAHHEQAGVWWLDSPARALFKAPAWGWATAGPRHVFILSFSPKAVLENRHWLATHAAAAAPATPPSFTMTAASPAGPATP